MAEKIHVLGAGLSGMVAAINLAHKGREVIVIEGAKKIGGMGGLHPSVHTTPIDPVWMSEQVGINLTSSFQMPNALHLALNERIYSMGPRPMYCVERGHRKSAIDTLLYNEACKAGVTFEFGQYLRDLRELPKGSIIATGLHPEMFDYFEIPFEIPRGFSSVQKSDREPWCAVLMSSYTDDYFYANCTNNLMYGLLFGRSRVTDEGLEKCRVDIQQKFGLDLEEWTFFTGRVPTGSAKNPRLFQDGYILAGTLAGAMDPTSLFGIHGAILSGKIAAEAVENPDKAMREFKRMNRFYKIGYYLKELQKVMPFKLAIFEFNVNYPRFPMMKISSLAVPGYPHGDWGYEMSKSRKRIA